MKIKSILALIILIITVRFYFPFEYRGWNNIKDALADGDGSEFVMNIGLPSDRFSTFEEAFSWVISHMSYKSDPNPPDVWTSSTNLYTKIVIEGQGRGDCEDYAILLCALLRYHTSGGISEDRVWVAVDQVPGGVHAWVQYIDEDGIQWNLDPLYKVIKHGNPIVRLTFNDKWVYPINDVKQGKMFYWNSYSREISNKWLQFMMPPIFLIFITFVFLKIVTIIDLAYYFYSLLLLSLLYLIILFVS